jgi:hypothetical protein
MDQVKKHLINTFVKNIYGKSPDIKSANPNHDGAKGDWLHLQFGQSKDNANEADFSGYECKNHTKSKTTWGDWTANYYIYQDLKYQSNRDEFLLAFGSPNPEKNNRISWSGKVCGKYHNQMRASGQFLYVDENKDISIFYDYEYDQREYKSDVVPTKFRDRDLLIAKWIGYKKNNHYKKTSLEEKVNKKFNQKGFFKCLMENGVYSKIVFGEPINFDNWISHVKDRYIYFDSGMYEGNDRPYSNWRSDNKFWDILCNEEYSKNA